jgi:hypothetical protein
MMRPVIASIALMPLLAACAATAPERAQPAAVSVSADCPSGETPALRSALYFGSDIPGGGTVDAAAWQAFLADEASRRFPDGLTWFEGHGQWRADAGALVHEASRVLILLHPADRETQQRVDALADAYRQRFAQEAVLVERSAVCMQLR